MPSKHGCKLCFMTCIIFVIAVVLPEKPIFICTLAINNFCNLCSLIFPSWCTYLAFPSVIFILMEHTKLEFKSRPETGKGIFFDSLVAATLLTLSV